MTLQLLVENALKHNRTNKKNIRILWDGNLWTSGYYVNTVSQYGNKDVIRKYIEN
ncbi:MULTISPECIES: transposase [unclassified Chryseobacterium]|uniref:transposase n=1 Tax=unclassified Chryseobacterium TaxID=2593645 RepID=UPI001E5BA2BE|nr:transposase [Chryseobacterium sp. BIGb0232]MCS4302094.1 REP element-mobilizing transposase RayT [Chryseobacterium sp. BIGb0232]